MEDMDQNIVLFEWLCVRGVGFFLDDFGIGYLFFNYLKWFLVDMFKIDCIFIMDLVDNLDDVVIIRVIIEMVYSFIMSVVVEGVEIDQYLNILCEMGCDSIQGYLISWLVLEDEFYDIFFCQ